MKSILKGLVVLTLLLLVGCSKVTQSNFEKIQPGMTRAEVVAILGEPTSEGSLGVGQLSGTSAVWKSDDKAITIVFVNDKVKLKSFAGDKTLKVQTLDKDTNQKGDANKSTNGTQDGASSGGATQDSSTQDGSTKDSSTKDNSTKDSSTQDNSTQDNSTQDNSTQDNSQ